MDVGPDFESCAIIPPEILIPITMRVLSSHNYKNNEITHAPHAIRATHWSRTILAAIDGPRLHRMMARLRLSRSPESDPRALVSAFALSLSGESQISPCDFERCRSIIARFSLYKFLPSPDSLLIIRRVEATLISNRAI